jgi:hypothetical protein
MQKLMSSLAATAALVLCGSAFWVAQATPMTGPMGTPSEFSPIEKVGCAQAGDNCPYGQRIVRGGGHGWWCEPCGYQKHGHYQQHYRDYDNRDYEPRHYRDY